MELKKVLCLDLDGTVRRSKSGKTFIEGPEDIEIIPGMKELIWRYDEDGWLIIYVTNQGGVAHGFKTMEDAEIEIQATLDLLAREDPCDGDTYHPCFQYFLCPFQESGRVENYSFRSLGRKPAYGMLVAAEETILESGYIPDWNNSLFVGDRPEDEECANNAGIPFMWAHEFLKQQTNNETTSTPGTDAQ